MLIYTESITILNKSDCIVGNIFTLKLPWKNGGNTFNDREKG